MQMDASNELLTIAELAVGLAGFSGVVAALSHRGKLGEIDRFHFIILFSVSFIAVFLCFVPFAANKFTPDIPTLWMASSSIMLVVSVLTAFALNRAVPDSLRAAPPTGLLGGQLIGSGLPLAIFLSQIANIIGWPLGSDSLLYVAGVLGWLLVAGLNFLRIILHGPTEKA